MADSRRAAAGSAGLVGDLMSERRAAPRVPLSVQATIYDGQMEIRCKTRNISRLGVAVAGIPEGLSGKALRLRLSVSDKAPSVLCDCLPVGKHPDCGGTWGLRFLEVTGDLPVGFQKLIDEAMKEPSIEAGSQSEPPTSQDMANGSHESGNSDRADFEKQLQDLYGEALASLD